MATDNFPPAGRPIDVLLVEDDPHDARRVCEVLEGNRGVQFRIAQAQGVEQALAMLKKGIYHVVLLDLTLPEGEGLETLERAKVAAASVPIVVMTPEEDEQQALRALRLGAQDYLWKAKSDPHLLVRTLRYAVERHGILTDLQSARRREHYLATHDSLTGLPNRYFFSDYVQRALALAERKQAQLAVLFLDLDRFKNVNDSLGHPQGDELLKEVASRFAGVVRRSDMVARVGGDEFLFLLQDVRDHFAGTVCEKILGVVSRPHDLEGTDCWVTASIGIAMYPRDGTDPDALIRCADTAMYQAKDEGPNNYRFYSEEMNDIAHKRLTLESRLRAAVTRDELEIVYQPQVDIHSGAITGAEALLRWQDAELGAIGPNEFIPVAEETRLILPLGEWVLQQACAQMAAWHEEGFPSLRISVNVSPYQLTEDLLRENVMRALWDNGLEPQHLELELTESALMKGDPLASDVLRELKRSGVSVALDDFGTGYCSLSYLKMIPVDAVKIDRSFVQEMVLDSDDAAIVSAVTSIAKRLKLRVIAEGVETREQMECLRRQGCHEFQGYVFSRPLSADAFLKLLQQHAAERG